MKQLLHILWYVFLSGISVAALFGAYLGYVWYRGYSLVRVAPREDMWVCEKGHGPMPKNALIRFMNQDFCPICFHKNLSSAEKGIM